MTLVGTPRRTDVVVVGGGVMGSAPVVVGAGSGGHGSTSAPAAGRVLADLALGQPGVPALALAAAHANHTAVTV